MCAVFLYSCSYYFFLILIIYIYIYIYIKLRLGHGPFTHPVAPHLVGATTSCAIEEATTTALQELELAVCYPGLGPVQLSAYLMLGSFNFSK
jgi:hypothetical protein